MLPHALRALRSNYPDIKISLLTRPLFKPLFEGLGVDFVPVDLKGEHKGIKGIWRLAGQIKALGIDAVADTHGVLRSKLLSLFLRLKGVWRQSSINKGRFGKWRRTHHKGSITGLTPLKHTVVRYCDTLRGLGFSFENPQPAEKTSRTNPMGSKSGTWIGFAPFSAQKGKCYPLEQSRELIALLAPQCEKLFIHSGGGSEVEFAREMQAQHSNVVAVFDNCKFAQEIDLISNMDCVISMDSLVMHLSSLVATPVISVWGATHPALGFLGYGCSSENIVQQEMDCRPCSTYGKRACRYGDYRCIATIPASTIADKALEIIK